MSHTVTITRRALCAGTGNGVVLVFAGGALRAADLTTALPDGEAYSLWRLWNDRSLHGTPFALVAAAVLAANPHDSQPWLFHVRDNAIDIYADLSRNLGAMDGYVREMHLGLGCAIQNAMLAAPVNGYAVASEASPASLLSLADRRNPILAATLHLTPQRPSAPDALYRAIPDRHTNRYGYDRSRPLPLEWLGFARHADVSDDVRVFLFEDGKERDTFDAAVVEATEAIIADKTMIADSDRWLRTSHAEIETHRDGPTLEAAGLSTLMLWAAKLTAGISSISHQGWLAQTRDTQVPTGRVMGIIAVRDRYDRPNAIAAGRTWQRLHLNATAHGIAMQPLNQPIEMIDRERATGQGNTWAKRLTQLTGPEWQATFSFRAGYSTEDAGPSPRRALRDVVFNKRTDA
jgi:hypothetical protein